MLARIRNALIVFAAYGLLLQAMLVLAIYFWPDFEKNIQSFELLANIGVIKNLIAELKTGGVSTYIVGQQFFKGCTILGCAGAVLFAVSAVANEAHRGTLEIWLARPQSRRRVLLERYFGGALILVLPVFLTSATIPALLDWVDVDEEMRLWPLMLCSVHQSLFLLLVYSFSFLLSTRGSHPIRIALWMLFLAVFQFSIYLVKVATHYSLFRLVDVRHFTAIVRDEALNPVLCLSMLGGSVLCLALSIWSFDRRTP